MTTFALNNLWNYIQGLHLSKSNRMWLADKLLHSTEHELDLVEPVDVKKEELTYEELPLTPRVRHLKSLHKKINITKEEIENDERMAYILSK